MEVNIHHPITADVSRYPAKEGCHDRFCTLNFRADGGKVTLFLSADQMNAATAIADIFNGNVDALAERIEDVMDYYDMSTARRDFARVIACDLAGKDLSEALRQRPEAENAE